MRRLTALFLFLLLSGLAFAQSGDDLPLRHLQAALDAIRQEQQSVYQQFQMLEALRQGEMQSSETGVPGVYVKEGQAPSYDDAARAREERLNRIRHYADELQRLSARYRDLGNQGAALVEKISNLAQTR